MSEYEIELVSKKGHLLIGEANDEVSALTFMDEAIRKFPTGHIRIRRETAIVAERLPPRIHRCHTDSPRDEAGGRR